MNKSIIVISFVLIFSVTQKNNVVDGIKVLRIWFCHRDCSGTF